jgi:hypothetical protein
VNPLIIESEERIIQACDQALSLAPQEYQPDRPPLKESWGTVQNWYPYEHEAWKIGEQIRAAFVKVRALKKKDSLLARVAKVATCRNLRRGRQSFIMALGFVDANKYAPVLAPLLGDQDVGGHVLGTLIKMKASGFANEARPLLNSDRAWIRRLARTYIERYPGT